jgi:hypothetical protein
MTYREAADVLAVPIGTIMSRLAAARAKLADLGREQKSSRDQKSVRDQQFGAEDAPSESSERHDQSGR